MNTKLTPEKYDLALANAMLDKLGYKKGSDGIRVTPGADSHPMAYDVITPDSLSGIDREFAIVRDSFAKIGVKLTQRSYDATTAFAEITKPKNQYLDFDLMMWDWVGYTDPDFVLSVVGCDQYGGWSDTAYCNKAYDKLYQQQGHDRSGQAQADHLEDAGHPLPRQAVHPARPGRADLGFRKGWTGIDAALPERPRQDALDRSGTAASARMRSIDYVVKRIAFALATIFVAITLNFVIFRAAPGDATTALRCLSCTDEVRAQVRRSSASTSPSGSSTGSTSRTSRTVTSGARSRTGSPCCRSSGSRSRTRCRCCCSARSSRSSSAS